MTGDLACVEGIAVRLGRRKVLHDVDLAVRGHEVLAVVGPNGAGKSTLLKVLAGVTPVARGRIVLAGEAHHDRSAWARTVAYLPQTFAPHWRIPVRDLVALGRRRGAPLFGSAAGEPRDFDPIAALGLEALSERMVQDLSGGERARAALAWALAGNAPLLAADEPIAALDPAQQIRTLDLLRRLRGRVASVVVLHDLNLALRYADRIAVVADGRCIACKPPADLIAGTTFDAAFGVDFARVLWDGGTLLAPFRMADPPSRSSRREDPPAGGSRTSTPRD